MKQTIICRTRIRKGEPQKTTTLVVDWEGITMEQLKAGFLQSLVIRRQNRWRHDGAIPDREELVAREHAPGVRVVASEKPTKETLKKTYTRDELIAMLRELEAEGK